MQKQRARNLDERLDDMQEAITEQLTIVKALATSQALAVEQQGQTFLAQMNTDSLLRKVNLNVVTVVKTTDSILGISKRTEALVTAARNRDYWTFAGLFLDPWCCLYAYMLLHPVAPIITERLVSVWQFVLLVYRLLSFVEDLLRSAIVATSASGLITLYFTSPYKALYYLYWLNRAFVYGEIQARGLTFDLTLPAPSCSLEISSKSFVCAADFTVTSAGLVLSSFKTALMNSDVAMQLSTLFSLEWLIWYSILHMIYEYITGALYSMLPTRLKYFF
jgi:hypothetical protein